MEKWRNEIEEILSKSRTVDRWIIHDFVWQETQPTQIPIIASVLNHLATGVMLLSMGPGVIPEAEWRERVSRSLSEAGLPREMIDDAIDWFKRNSGRALPWPKAGSKQPTDGGIREAFGDDE